MPYMPVTEPCASRRRFHGRSVKHGGIMSTINGEQWEKELRALLDQIQAHPSRDSSQERQRIAVLKNLVATRGKAVPA